jgi:hypothetical protein
MCVTLHGAMSGRRKETAAGCFIALLNNPEDEAPESDPQTSMLVAIRDVQ